MTQDPHEAQAIFDRATKRLKTARSELAASHAELQRLIGSVANARARGQINQRIWDVERALSLHDRF